jgi:multisubunit Na+/H+ antiporter MnhF subunit
MRESNKTTLSNFGSKDAAFEFLVQESQNNIIKEKWKKELDQIQDSSRKIDEIFSILNFKNIVLFLLILGLLLFSVYRLINGNSTPQKMAHIMLLETNISTVSDSYTRGLKTLNDSNLAIELQNEINSSLTLKDYNAAIGLLYTKEQQSQLTVEDKFYYALSISQIENADYYKAIRLLEDVTSKNEKFINESLWLQGLLHLKIGNPIKSKIILTKLSNSSNYQKENTKALLKMLDDE